MILLLETGADSAKNTIADINQLSETEPIPVLAQLNLKGCCVTFWTNMLSTQSMLFIAM